MSQRARSDHDPPTELPISARDLLEAVPDAIVGVDREGRIAFLNLQAERLFAYARDEMIGRPVELLLPDRLMSVHARHREAYEADPATRPIGADLALVARRKDGTEFPVEVSLSPFRTRSGIQVVSAIRDITHRRDVETKRQRVLEIAEHARGEAEASHEVRAQAERLKDDLTNMIVHGLKNPVTGIAMLVQLLPRRGPLSDLQQRILVQIDRMCREMLRLIANVLEITKIEAGRMPVHLEPIVLAELADEVEAEYGPIARDVGRRLTVTVGSDLPPAAGDRPLLKRVLVNLVANALRQSGRAEIAIAAAPDPARSSVTIRVVDSGRGIPDDEHARIFEKFTTRGDSTADTALGLPFCKLAVERMGGRIALKSAIGVGTEFAVSLRASG